MDQSKTEVKALSFRMGPAVREFVESNAAKTCRSTQGMLDYLMKRLIEMEKKGEFEIQ